MIATDLDRAALDMVEMAAEEQGLGDRLSTRTFDLTTTSSDEIMLPVADLYVMSDVFESGLVAEGAAWHVRRLLSTNTIDNATEDDTDNRRRAQSRIWVFAQSDRAQREIFLESLRKMEGYADIDWTADHEPDVDARIWLFDLNEMDVQYN